MSDTLRLATIVPDGVYDDGIHQPREHTVPCAICHRPTWNHNAHCNAHQPVSAK